MPCFLGRAAFLSLGLAAMFACSSGSLDNLHDPYLQIFGMRKPPLVEAKGAFLGRAVHGKEGAAWAQIYARRLPAGREDSAPTASANSQDPLAPLETTGNEKGGFLLAALEPGAWRIIATTTSGEGVVRDVTIAAGQMVEEPNLNLDPLRRVTGKVTLEHEPVATGVVVYAPGTPFSSFSDHEGYFMLTLPDGEFSLRAEKDGFVAQDSASLSLTGDQALEFTLTANPWPNGRISVKDAEGGYIVRSLTPTLAIAPVAGVKYMRMLAVPNLLSYGDFVKWIHWQPVQAELTLQLAEEGGVSIDMEFMDNFGKVSEPVNLQFIATVLDSTWTILYGNQTKPVHIVSGQKVAFLSAGPYAVNSPVANDAPVHIQLQLRDESVRYSESSKTSAVGTAKAVTPDGPWSSPTFTQSVTVEAGAVLRGGAYFAGPLTLLGTKQKPISWDGLCGNRTCGNEVLGPKIVWHYVAAKNLYTDFGASSGSQLISIADSTFSKSHINQSVDSAYYGPRTESNLVIDHSSFADSWIAQSCERLYSYGRVVGGGTDGDGQPDAGSGEGSGTASGATTSTTVPAELPQSAGAFTLLNSVLATTPLWFGCRWAPDFHIDTISAALRGNVFGEPGSAAVNVTFWNADGTDAAPAAEVMTFSPGPNYFSLPARAAKVVEPWPVAILGEKLTTSPPGVGPR